MNGLDTPLRHSLVPLSDYSCSDELMTPREAPNTEGGLPLSLNRELIKRELQLTRTFDEGLAAALNSQGFVSTDDLAH